MKLKPVTRCLLVLVACMAVMLSALVPSISFAFSSRDATGASGFFICSTVKKTDVQGAASSQSSQPAEQFGHTVHCPYCATHAGSFALPPSQALVLPLILQQNLAPTLFYESHSPLFVWASVQSRAPPLVS